MPAVWRARQSGVMRRLSIGTHQFLYTNLYYVLGYLILAAILVFLWCASQSFPAADTNTTVMT